MRPMSPVSRSAVLAAVAVAVLTASGCSWLRKDRGDYAKAPQDRALEVPPDLDRPNTAGAMKAPGETAQSVTRSSMPAPAPSSGSTSGFTVTGERDAVFARVGEALAATAGVTIASKAQLLGTYDVDFEGSKFLVRVTSVDSGVYVSAVDPRGMPATDAAALRLVAALKTALGG